MPTSQSAYLILRDCTFHPAIKLAITCGKRMTSRMTMAAIQNRVMLKGLRLWHRLRRTYNWMKPMPSRAAAMTSSQGRADCNRTLAPASPSAPRKVRGKQQASVESATTTAATGVTRSATCMRIFTLSAWRLKSRPAAIPRRECRSGLHTGDMTSWEPSSGLIRHPRR